MITRLKFPSKDALFIGQVGFFALFALFLFLRLYRLGQSELWYDEVHSANFALQSVDAAHLSWYYVLLKFWVRYLGLSEYALRFPSAIFSFLSVIVIYQLGKTLFDRKTGIISAVFMGLSPFHLWYAQEARDYSLALFLGTLSTYLICLSLRRRVLSLWAAFILLCTAGIFTSPFYIILFIAQLILVIILRWNKLTIIDLLSFAIIAFIFLIVSLPTFLSKYFTLSQGFFWLPRPELNAPLITFENFILGYNGTYTLYLAVDILLLVSFIASFKNLLKIEDKTPLILCVFLILVPTAATFLFSRLFFSVYLDRALIIFSPYLYLLLAAGIASWGKKIRILVLLFLLPCLFVAAFRYYSGTIFEPLQHHTGAHPKKPIKPAIEFLRAHALPTDIIAFTNQADSTPFKFYSPELSSRVVFFFDPRIVDPCWNRPFTPSTFYIPLQKIDALHATRIWVVSSEWGRWGGLDPNCVSVNQWLASRFELELERNIDDLHIFRYVK